MYHIRAVFNKIKFCPYAFMLDKLPVRYNNRQISFNIAMLSPVCRVHPGAIHVPGTAKTTIKF